MRNIRSKTLLAAVGLALSVSSLAACGNAGGGDSESVDVKVDDKAASSFDEGTKMKELADAGKITIGVKFDQPGIGFKGATDDMPGWSYLTPMVISPLSASSFILVPSSKLSAAFSATS